MMRGALETLYNAMATEVRWWATQVRGVRFIAWVFPGMIHAVPLWVFLQSPC